MTQGRCHLCRQITEIVYCGSCEHWFCASCRSKYWARGKAFIMQLIGGKVDGCCGPLQAGVKSKD